MDVEPVVWQGSPSEARYSQYRAFKDALSRIAIDMHFVALADPHDPRVSASQLSVARLSVHWSDELWVARNASNRILLLAKAAAAALLTDEANALTRTVTQFSERSERWTQLASLAWLYDDGRQMDFLAHAAECLVGYGWRKDLGAMDVLDAVVEVSKNDPAKARARLDRLVPIVEMITEFTDGDETNHVRSELIEAVAKVAPERLPSLYEHHLSVDEYSYADECLAELVELVDLGSAECAALISTLLDERALAILRERARKEPTAGALLERQYAFLGHRNSAPGMVSRPGEGSPPKEETPEVNPTSFGPQEFSALVAAASGLVYERRAEFLGKWLRHWRGKGKAVRALRAIFSYFETGEASLDAESVLDEAFRVSLAVEGREAAYPWLVRAHVHRHGWQSFYTSESEVMARIRLASQHYADRWLAYIRDTSTPAPYYKRRRFSFVIGYKYLVRFLVLVGQIELADRIAASFVDVLAEEVREQPIRETPWFR
jgi:hypothetical protein